MAGSRILSTLIGAMVAVAAMAQVPAPLSSQQAPAQAIASEASIGARDVIEIRVVQDQALNLRVTVSDDGTITMPPLGKVVVSGLTLPQIEQRIKSMLEARYLNKADVTVDLLEAGSKPISVIGAVTHPGRINVTGNITLIQALTQAGGLATGYGKTVYVLRSAPNGLTDQIAIDIDDLMVNGNPDLNLPLRPNDVVNIPVDTMINIYVLGEVMRPGKVQFRRSQSPMLLQALADAGGPTDRAAARCVIKRKVNGKEQNIMVDYKKILNGKAPDVSLQDDDTIYVKESTF
jgi:polysaccharide export outer membrane protein